MNGHNMTFEMSLTIKNRENVIVLEQRSGDVYPSEHASAIFATLDSFTAMLSAKYPGEYAEFKEAWRE